MVSHLGKEHPLPSTDLDLLLSILPAYPSFPPNALLNIHELIYFLITRKVNSS